MINMFIRILMIFHHLDHVGWKRRGLCVVGSPPQGDRPRWNEQRERCCYSLDKIKDRLVLEWLKGVNDHHWWSLSSSTWSRSPWLGGMCTLWAPSRFVRSWWGLGSHGRRFQGSGGSGRGRAPNIRISKLILVSEIAYYFYTFRRTLFKEIWFRLNLSEKQLFEFL